MKNKTKKVIALMGNREGCGIASRILHNNGFYVISVNEKVTEIAKHLLKIEKISEEDIKKVREKGYLVNRLYWINMVLSSIPSNKESILINDIRLEDLIDNVISAYYITKDKDEKMPRNINKIIFDENVENFTETLKKEFNHMFVRVEK